MGDGERMLMGFLLSININSNNIINNNNHTYYMFNKEQHQPNQVGISLSHKLKPVVWATE